MQKLLLSILNSYSNLFSLAKYRIAVYDSLMSLNQKEKTILSAIITTIQTVASMQNVNDQLLFTTVILTMQKDDEKFVRTERIPRPKSIGFWTEIFPYLGDSDPRYNFKYHFRIKRTTFNRLIEILSEHENYRPSAFKNQIPMHIQLGVVLHRLANPMSYRQLELFLGVSVGSVANFTRRFIQAVLDSLKYIIRWPSDTDLQSVMDGFAPVGLKRLPNVIGAIDGSHIPIKQPPTVHHKRYINRKNFHSIVLMAIVDDTEKFTYVYSGQPGSMHDARVLRQSSFWRDAINVSCLRCDILKQLLTIIYF